MRQKSFWDYMHYNGIIACFMNLRKTLIDKKYLYNQMINAHRNASSSMLTVFDNRLKWLQISSYRYKLRNIVISYNILPISIKKHVSLHLLLVAHEA